MKLGTLQRRAILAGALVATVAAALMPEEQESPVAPRGNAARAVRPAKTMNANRADEPLPQLAVEKLAQAPSREAVLDAFEARSWAPPPPKPAPPPPPQAPPLPFRYIGKMIEDGKIVVFLARQDSNFAVRAGDRLGVDYQVDEIGPAAITLTYLPLGQKQTLAIGAVN